MVFLKVVVGLTICIYNQICFYICIYIWASLMAQRLKRMPAMWET